MLCVLLVGYLGAVSPTVVLPLPVRAALVAVFSVAALHKLLLLTVSLPLHGPPPRSAFMHCFFVRDIWSLMAHVAEAFTVVSGLAYWWCIGTLPLPCFLPFAAAMLIPIGKVCFWQHPSLDCAWRATASVLLFAVLVLLAPLGLVVLMWHYPSRAFHPLDAGLHIYVAAAAIYLCVQCESSTPVVALWSVHSAFLALGLLELALVKRLSWKEGNLWWFALQITALAMYVANACCVFSEGLGAPDSTDLVVFAASNTWLCLLCAMTVAINWSRFAHYYRLWQSRHGIFSLQVPAVQNGGFLLGEGVGAPPAQAQPAEV